MSELTFTFSFPIILGFSMSRNYRRLDYIKFIGTEQNQILIIQQLIDKYRQYLSESWMFKLIEPPTEKIALIIQIFKFLFAFTLLQSIFLTFSQPFELKSLAYYLSCIAYVMSWRHLSYFGCVANSVFNLAVIWVLLLQMAKKLQNGLYELYLSSEGIYKMSSLIFCIVCLYFNFSGYQEFKQIAIEIFQYENKDSGF